MKTHDRALKLRGEVEEQRKEILMTRDVTALVEADMAAVRADTDARTAGIARSKEALAVARARYDTDFAAAQDKLNGYAEELEDMGDVDPSSIASASSNVLAKMKRGNMDAAAERNVRPRAWHWCCYCCGSVRRGMQNCC
jgi:hypothetical protein